MSRRLALIALSAAAAALTACGNPTAPQGKPNLGVYNGSSTRTSDSSERATVSTQGVYNGSST